MHSLDYCSRVCASLHAHFCRKNGAPDIACMLERSGDLVEHLDNFRGLSFTVGGGPELGPKGWPDTLEDIQGFFKVESVPSSPTKRADHDAGTMIRY